MLFWVSTSNSRRTTFSATRSNTRTPFSCLARFSARSTSWYEALAQRIVTECFVLSVFEWRAQVCRVDRLAHSHLQLAQLRAVATRALSPLRLPLASLDCDRFLATLVSSTRFAGPPTMKSLASQHSAACCLLLQSYKARRPIAAAVTAEGAAYAWDLTNLARVQDHFDKSTRSRLFLAIAHTCVILLLATQCASITIWWSTGVVTGKSARNTNNSRNSRAAQHLRKLGRMRAPAPLQPLRTTKQTRTETRMMHSQSVDADSTV